MSMNKTPHDGQLGFSCESLASPTLCWFTPTLSEHPEFPERDAYYSSFEMDS